MRLVLMALLSLLVIGTARAESVYTKLNLDACKTIKADDQGGVWQCAGWGGYPIEFSEGDLRQSLFIGHLGAWAKKGHWESFSAFNRFGGTVEWIVDGKVAKAAISRIVLENSNPETGDIDPKSRGEVLIVYKVGQKGEGEACAVGYVDARANPNPNELARNVAASAVSRFTCRKDEPQWHGVKGPTVGDAYRYYEE